MMPSKGTAPGAPNLRTVIAKALFEFTVPSDRIGHWKRYQDAYRRDADTVIAAIAAAGMVIGRPVTYESLTNDDFNQLDEFGVLDGDPETFTGMLEAFAACGFAVVRVADDV